jgi:hypothetical protein
MPWSRRDTVWKQENVLARENFQEAGLVEVSDAYLTVAISHDCDIANDNLEAESEEEFIFARIIEELAKHKYETTIHSARCWYHRSHLVVNGKTRGLFHAILKTVLLIHLNLIGRQARFYLMAVNLNP